MPDRLRFKDVARRSFLRNLVLFGGLSLLSTKLNAETLRLGRSTWSLADSHVGSTGMVMVYNHVGGSSLFYWDRFGNQKANIKSKGLIFTPFVGKSGRVLFAERTQSETNNFKIYEVAVTSDGIEVAVLKESDDYMGFPTSIRNSVDGSVAIVSGPYLRETQGNPVPDRKVEAIGANNKHYASKGGLSSIGRLCQVSSQDFVAVSGLNQQFQTIPSGTLHVTPQSNIGTHLFVISVLPTGIGIKPYSGAILSIGTLLDTGASELDGKFLISSVSFPNSGGRQISISCVDFESGKSILDFALPAGADIGPPTILLNNKSRTEIAFLASESKPGNRGPVEVWTLDLVDKHLLRVPLEVDRDVSSLTLEI